MLKPLLLLSAVGISLILAYAYVANEGNSVSATKTITINDTTPPINDTTPPSVTITTPPNCSTLPAGIIVVEGTASDESPGFGVKIVKVKVDEGAYKVTTPKAPGDWSAWSTTVSIMTAGSHKIVAKAYDVVGNYEWGTSYITIVSPAGTPPAPFITAPADISAKATGTLTTVQLGTPTVSDNLCYLPTVTNDAPPNGFPVGTTIVTWTATDASGNSASDTQLVTITDIDPINDDNLPTPLRTINVSSISTLMEAIAAAKPGDHIVLRNGIYDTTSWLNAHSATTLLIRAQGTQQAPIVITAETIGGAVITGPGGFQLNGASYLIIRGFKLSHSQDNSQYSDDIAIRCQNCKYVRFTQNHFQLTTRGGHSDWLGLRSGSDHNRVDHNTFANKKTHGVFLLIVGSYYDRIDHNYFFRQSYSLGNGGECMRIGNSENALNQVYAIVELNLFEQCNGDREAITVKSSNNILRWNTFRNNAGSLTLRHGNDNLVAENFFLYGQNGVRIYGHNHKIINNYFEGNYGRTLRTTLVLGSGSVSEDLTKSNNEHSQPQNIVIAFNTFTKNISNMLIGYGIGSLPPTNVKISHNILRANSGDLVTVYRGANLTWERNIMFGGTISARVPETGYTLMDPMLVLADDGLYRLGNNSPAIDRADSNDYPYIIVDMDGQPRSGMLDTGADEYSAEQIIRKPLLPTDVGPNGV